MDQQVLSDETWAVLDPKAGALSRRTVRRLWGGLAGLVVLLVAGGLVWRSGLAVPRLGNDEGPLAESGVSGPGVHLFTVSQRVTNHGWHTERVIGAGRDGPGLELVKAHGLPRKIPPGESITIRLSYRVTDCGTRIPGAWPVPVRVHRPWGDVTTDIWAPFLEGDAVAPAWQVERIRQVCRR